MSENKKIIIGAIVENHFGVLNRVTALFSRRGYNIDSLAVGVTNDINYSRMTIVSTGDEYIKNQMVKQLAKLVNVVKVGVIDDERSVKREHMLIKIKVENGSNPDITTMINEFGAKVVDFCATAITAEVTGDVESNDLFVEKAVKYGIMEICRAGAQALHIGNECL